MIRDLVENNIRFDFDPVWPYRRPLMDSSASGAIGTPVENLERLGLILPPAQRPDASYRPLTRQGQTVYVSGQLPRAANGIVELRGRLGADVTLEQGQACARLCALHLLAQLQAELGSLERVQRILKLHVYVASTPEFAEQHLVANAASDLLGEVLVPSVAHARTSLGVASLPHGSPVEVDAVVEVDSHHDR
jgi:enamine deaminase RidA (YjgF/YER057c/UK114 family)